MTAQIVVALDERLRNLFFDPERWARLGELGEVSWGGPTSSERGPGEWSGLAAALHDADVLITGWTTPRLGGPLLAGAPRLRLVAHTGAAVRFLVSDEVFARGIRVTQVGEAMAPAVAEVALTFTLALLHRVHRFDHALHAGSGWDEAKAGAPPRRELRGSTVGVVGASRSGRAYLAKLRALGAEVLLTDPIAADAADLGARLVPLDELLTRSRIVALHAPAIPETRHLIGARELALLPDGAGLVNTARSWLVDTDALLAELRTGRIDAALDVFDEEPLPPGDPLRGLPNVLLTPHEAAGTEETRRRQGEIVVAEIARFLAGEPLRHEITRERLIWTA